jgi:hypothetical protein
MVDDLVAGLGRWWSWWPWAVAGLGIAVIVIGGVLFTPGA